jgi:oligopeptide/dipeptide ABC transporter ATP-binding protein
MHFAGVSRHFGSKRSPVIALDDIELEVYAGETLGIVGESGSGKSTLAHIAVGLDRATDGRVMFQGRKVSPADLRKQAQMVFQDPGSSLDPLRTIEDSVTEPLHAIASRHKRTERVAEVLNQVGLGSLGSRLPKQLSGGQKQRASIARALGPVPPVIVCDEAVTALDVSVRASVLNLLKKLQAELGTTMLFISHDISVVRYMSDRIVVMYLGQIMEIVPAGRIHEAGHPYSHVLQSAIPVMQQGAVARPRILAEGERPSVTRAAVGCRFASRCPLTTDKCRTETPALREVEQGHWVACHYGPVNYDQTLKASTS